MIAHTSVNAYKLQDKAAVHEAMRILSAHTAGRRWVCESCGMVHTAPAPVMCESCGSTTTLLQADSPREMNSRW
jgi:rubrerythrin